jgi:CheY-like chemotaxis protein
MKPRPTLLVAEPEPQQALSVRKLVIETGKFNVLAAHSTREALEIFRLFPNLSVAILVGEDEIDANEIDIQIKQADDKIPVIIFIRVWEDAALMRITQFVEPRT